MIKEEETRILLLELVDNTGLYGELELIEELARRIDAGFRANHYHSRSYLSERIG